MIHNDDWQDYCSRQRRIDTSWCYSPVDCTQAATPDFIQQKPNTIVQGAGMLGGLVYGIDEDGEWYFNGSGKRPEELKKEEE